MPLEVGRYRLQDDGVGTSPGWPDPEVDAPGADRIT
jgi:hypothetical protein